MLEFGVELEKFIRGNLVFYDIEHRRMRLTDRDALVVKFLKSL